MRSRKGRPVLAVCIEVLGPDLLDEWIREGWMPNLERIRRTGGWAPLESVSDLSSGSIWPTFFTGANPGRHGQFFTHMQIEPGTYRIVKKYADDVPLEPFWRELSRAGRSSAVIDVPQTRPIEPFRGVHVAGWGGEYPAWPRSSSPAGLMGEIVDRFGFHPLVDRYRVAHPPETKKQYRLLREKLLHGVRAKAELSRWVLDREPFDFFLTVFSEPHWAMHLLRELEGLGRYSAGEGREPGGGGTFRDLFGRIDQSIGELSAARPDADLLVFSLSGMGPNVSGWHILPDVLERIGMGPGKRDAGHFRKWLPLPRWGTWKTRALEDLVSLRVIETARSILPSRWWDRWTRRILHAGNRWSESRAFCVPNDYSGAIRINLRGREPRGLVAPGAEYDALCGEIAEALLELTHVDTGRPVVREVLRTREVYGGKHVDALPDLLVLWANDSPIAGVESPRTGRMDRDFPERRTGAHRPRGFLVASGPRIRGGSTFEPAHLMDLAPTILHLAGVDVPASYEGRILTDWIFSAD